MSINQLHRLTGPLLHGWGPRRNRLTLEESRALVKYQADPDPWTGPPPEHCDPAVPLTGVRLWWRRLRERDLASEAHVAVAGAVARWIERWGWRSR